MSASRQKFDVYLSFRGYDTGHNFIRSFYRELDGRNIRTFKNDKQWESGATISPELIRRAMEESIFAIVVLSVRYTASPWCLEELVKIMDLEKVGSIEVIPIFYGVEPSHVRRQIGVVAEHFEKHEGGEYPEKVLSWRQALTNLANISGYSSYHWEDDSEMIGEITDTISKNLLLAQPKRSGSKLVEIDTHMEAIHRLLDLNSNKDVKVIGIWARGGNERSALAKFVYENISQHFESHCFFKNVKRISQHLHQEFLSSMKWISQDRHKVYLESVKKISQDRHKEYLESLKKISQDRHMSHLHKEFLIWIQGQSLSESRLKNKKVLLVADDVDKLEQLEALAEYFNNFGPGSRVIITTQDKQLLKSFGVTLVYELGLLYIPDSS
ncbi:Toll/interleukin-1 receptor-like protein [Cardamine amara subsp. amara]|uniref:Toll/interleukin-1 receptor-like protein n=1 Tax=Cardamine amara subsp. amara TaxID=228776 RepID=A0ABD1BM37_CARAN